MRVGMEMAKEFQSTRSQDRDNNRRLRLIALRIISIHSVARPRLTASDGQDPAAHFNPLGRKTETAKLNNY